MRIQIPLVILAEQVVAAEEIGVAQHRRGADRVVPGHIHVVPLPVDFHMFQAWASCWPPEYPMPEIRRHSISAR